MDVLMVEVLIAAVLTWCFVVVFFVN